MIRKILILGLLSMIAIPAFGQEATQEAQEELTLNQKVSRILAYTQIRQLQAQGVEFDMEQTIKGVKMAIEGEELGMSQEEMVSVMQAFEKEMREKAMAKMKMMAEENAAAAEKFFAENKDKEGVISLESGVQYKIIKDGAGATPTISDRVSVKYTGRLLDGTVFDSTGDGPPATLAVGGVIRGWTEVLQKMKVGEKIEVYIPSQLAYGENPRPGSPIGPNAALIFEIELVEIVK